MDNAATSSGRVSFFALAFRPFFIAGAAAAVALMLPWLLFLSGHAGTGVYFSGTLWHAHEMLFGFVAAVITGFLLTAVQTWTGLPGLRGGGLAGLVVLWLTGRLLMAFPVDSPLWINTVVDLLHLPVVAGVLGASVVRVKQWRNAIFIPILLLFFIANLLTHLEALGVAHTATTGLYLGLWLVLLLIIILGGRVLPMFTSNGLGGVKVHSWKPINAGSILFFVLLAAADLFHQAALAGWLAGVCLVFHTVRLWGWKPWLTPGTPLLWVLHIGYAWLLMGFFLYALSDPLALPRTVAVHAFAVGTIGNFIIGMMARVSLGHTGRPLKVNGIMAFAFALVNVAAFVRVLLPLMVPLPWLTGIVTAGLAWVLAFALFFIVYLPILGRPRVDGRPG